MIALDVGEAETEAFWRAFPTRGARPHTRREQQPMLAALLRPLFNVDSGEAARELVGDAL